jgi:hypothetical protein
MVPRTVSSFLVVVGALGAIASFLYGIQAFIDGRVKAAIQDPAFISQLSRNLRPSVVFDSRGSILADLGAMQHINDIRVVAKKDAPIEITVSPMESFAVEPVLESLDARFVTKAERGQKYDWIFRLYPIETLLVSDPPKVERLRFRLELIR